jgi:hypothetical protein
VTITTEADRANVWLIRALVESLSLNIELIEHLTAELPPAVRERVEVLKSTRRFLTGESEDEAPA